MFDTESEITDPGAATPRPAPPQIPAPAGPGIPGPLPRRVGAIRFEHVGFSFPAATRPVLRGVSLDLAARRDARAGRRHRRPARRRSPRWCPGWPTPTAGRVLLDGRDMRELPLPQLRSRGRYGVRGPDAVLGQRPGEPHPRPARTPTDDEVREALCGGPGQLRLRPAVGPGHPDRRAGHVAVRRPAAAARAGPRRAGAARGAGARRPAVRAGRAHRGAGRAGAAAGAGRARPRWSSAHRAVDGRARRPGGAAPAAA